MSWYQKYTIVIENISKIVWLILMLHWLSDGFKVSDIFK
jgi:hypothetical protein